LNFTKAIFAAGALSLASVSGIALAQDAAAPAAAVKVTAGMTIHGPEGNEVGTIESVTDGVATLDTGKHKVGLPLDRFGENAEGQTTVAVTRDQLNTMVDEQLAQAAAQLDALLVAGAQVVDVNGTPLGSVGAVEGEDVTVETEWGAFALKKANFLPGEGSVTAQVQADQIKSALGASEASAS
jgi:BarA-like signal transduction histidine kinase